MKKCKEWRRRLWMAVVTVGFAGLVSGAENNVWVGGTGSKEAPENWNVVTNWMQGQAAPAKVPNTPGSSNWAPLVLEGTQEAPLYVGTTARIEGYTFNLRASYADITIQELNKLQTDTAITLRNESVLRLGYLPEGHFEFNHVDVGDGCTLELTTPDVNACGGTFAFDLNLNTSGKMTMQAWSLGDKSGTVSFTLPLEAEEKAVQKRQLIGWPEGTTNNLSLAAGTVAVTAPWSASASVTEVNLFAENPEISELPLGAYQVQRQADGFWVAWVAGPAPDDEARASVSFDVPEGWTEKAVPTVAVQRSLTGNLALEQSAAFRQTLGGRVANVANITGSDGTPRLIFGVNDASHGNKDTPLERDVWLMVSGGSHDVIVGGSENHWQNNRATPLRGDIAVELGAGATVNNLIGAVYKGGYIATGAMNGNVLVTVKGTVKGGLVGGTLSAHNVTPVITGNTRVRVLAVQSTNANAAAGVGNRILGGSAYMTNTASGATQTGDAAVEVVLPAGTTGEFLKEIVGGSYAKNGSYAITGNTSVSISAPNGVTFSKPIYGGSVSDSSTATVSGDASVTLDGGTYTNSVYAGGYGARGGVSGKATLTLKGGIFTGNLGVGASGASVGSSELVIDGGAMGIDLSSATISDAFDTLTLKSGLNLGGNRLSGVVAVFDGAQTLTVTLADEEKLARRVPLLACAMLPEGSRVEVSNLSEGEAPWGLVEVGGVLYCEAPPSNREWKTPSDGSAWSAGLSGFQAGDNVTFGENNAQEPVTLSGDVRVGAMTVSGSYVLEGTGTVSADTVAVDGTLTVKGPVFRYLRLTPSGAGEASGNNAYPGIAELVLYKDGAPVAWPRGTTICQVNANGTVVEPVWNSSGNEKPNALIDGVYGGTTQAYTNPYDGSTGTYSASQNNNKWWPTGAAGASAVITLGAPVEANGYMIWHTDYVPRSPNACKLEASADGIDWVVLDDRTFFAQDARPSADDVKNKPYEEEPFTMVSSSLTGGAMLSAVEGMTVTGVLSGEGWITGDVTFAEGSQLRASAEGVPTIAGTVSGTVKLDLSAWGELDDSTVRPVLRASEPVEGPFVLTAPEGFVAHYADGVYWVTRALTQPLSLVLGSEAEWTQASWLDASEPSVAVVPAQWDVLPSEGITAMVKATADDATLMLEFERSVGSFEVQDSESTLTLGGAKLSPSSLTVAGKLAATPSTLTIPSGATINEGGTLTYDVPSGSVAMPAMAGTGRFIKTGAGTLTISDALTEGPMVEILQGTVSVSAVNKVYDGTLVLGGGTTSATLLFSGPDTSLSFPKGITLRNHAIVSFDTGRAWNGGSKIKGELIRIEAAEGEVTFRGARYGNGADVQMPLKGCGTLVLTQYHGINSWKISGAISDADGVLDVKVVKNGNAFALVTLSGDNSFSGGLALQEGTQLTLGHSNAAGRGAVSIATDAKLTVASGKTLNVYGALSGLGTITGPIVDEVATVCTLHLAEGASLDLSEATAEACLTLNGTLTAAGPIAVTLPQDVTSTRRLLAWVSAPEGVTFQASEAKPIAPTARLVTREDGLYYEALTLADGAQETFKGLSEATQRALASAAFDAGATSIAAVSGENIDGALQCFEGALTVTVDDAQAATLSVDYAFGIAAMKYNAAEGTFTVTARVQGAAEAQTVTFASGTTVEVVVDGTDESLASASVPASASASELTLTIPAEKAATLLQAPTPIRVRVKK